jgi:hypothetical protein
LPPIRQAFNVESKALQKLGLRGWHLHAMSMGSIALCIGLWIRAKTIGEDQRANAERRALFVGLWPPMFWLMGDTLEQRRPLAARSRRIVRALRR